MNDKQKAMTLNISFAALDSIREACIPSETRFTRLTRSINKLLALIDIYRPVPWPAYQLKKAGVLIDEFNLRIEQVSATNSMLVLLHVAFAAFETVRADEDKRSNRYMRLDNGIDLLLEWLSVFDPDEWPEDIIRIASKLGDEFNIRIEEVFGDINRGGIQA